MSFWALVSDTTLESGRAASAAIFRTVLQNSDDTRLLQKLLTEYTMEDFHRFPTSAAALLSATLDMPNLREDRIRMADRIRQHYHEKFGSSALIDRLT